MPKKGYKPKEDGLNYFQKLINNNTIFISVSLSIIFTGVFLAFALTEVNAEAIPEYKTAFTGTFDGTFDGIVVNVDGKYRVNNIIDTFVMIGTLKTADVNHFNPVTGKYVKSSPNCNKIIGDLVLQSVKGQLKLDFNGKKCQYGLYSYVLGTFEVIDANQSYKNASGNGRITFVTDHHNNSVNGQLKGSIRG